MENANPEKLKTNNLTRGTNQTEQQTKAISEDVFVCNRQMLSLYSILLQIGGAQQKKALLEKSNKKKQPSNID